MSNNTDKLIEERLQKIKLAYTKLPNPLNYKEGATYKVSCNRELWCNKPTLVTEVVLTNTYIDSYEFLNTGGRWVMTQEERNRHLYKGLYI
jgi:hypothetical protein